MQPPLDALRLGIPDDVVLTKEEEAELDSSMAYQDKIREQASPTGRDPSPAAKRGRLPAGGRGRGKAGSRSSIAGTAPSPRRTGGPPSEPPPPYLDEPPPDSMMHDENRYSAGLTTQELSSELCSERAIALLCDTEFLPGHRPSHLGLHGQSDGLTIFKEVGKRRRGRTEERWASSGGRKGARDMVFAPAIAANGGPFIKPAKELLDAPKTFALTNSTSPQVAKAAHAKLARLGPIVPAPTDMIIGNMDAVTGKRPPRRKYGSKKAEANGDTLLDQDEQEHDDGMGGDDDEDSLPPLDDIVESGQRPVHDEDSELAAQYTPATAQETGRSARAANAKSAGDETPVVVGVRRRCACSIPRTF